MEDTTKDAKVYRKHIVKQGISATMADLMVLHYRSGATGWNSKVDGYRLEKDAWDSVFHFAFWHTTPQGFKFWYGYAINIDSQ